MLGQLVASRLLARSFYSLVALGLALIFGVIADRRIDGLPAHRIARLGVGCTFQVIRVFAALIAMENLLGVSRGDEGVAPRRAQELLALVHLDGPAEEPEPVQRPVEAGGAGAGPHVGARLILLDEPAAGINRTFLTGLLDTVRELRAQGRTMLVVEHDRKVVMGLCEHVFVLDHGETVAEGSPKAIRRDERVVEA
jgi:branched-chain amino acid transport system ATP-binding protein